MWLNANCFKLNYIVKEGCRIYTFLSSFLLLIPLYTDSAAIVPGQLTLYNLLIFLLASSETAIAVTILFP